MYPRPSLRKAFTLIELLVVIAIIAILSVVILLTLNPAELLRQARDSNRVSDMATISNALNVYLTDQGSASSFSLGNASATYPSPYDTSATSTAGDQCQGLNLPALNASSGQYWQCSANTYQRLVNGTGWIPVNLSAISSGAPIGNLPVDPTNQTSTGLFYSYNTNGSQFEVTANLESSKNKSQYGANPQTSNFPEVVSGGTPTVSALYNPSGLVGYWNFDEGVGSTTADRSGNGNTGTWGGTPVGANGTYFTGGKIGSYAGAFDGSTDGVGYGQNNLPLGANPISVFAWVNPSTVTGNHNIFAYGKMGTAHAGITFELSGTYLLLQDWSTSPSWNVSLVPNTWSFVGFTYNGGATITMYINGLPNTLAISALNLQSQTAMIGFIPGGYTSYFNGSIDDIRVYNRALSTAEVMAMYTSEK